jgi:hypothetical protein
MSFENYCKSLHGLTKKQINEKVNSTIDGLEARAKRAPRYAAKGKMVSTVRLKSSYLAEI